MMTQTREKVSGKKLGPDYAWHDGKKLLRFWLDLYIFDRFEAAFFKN